MIHACHHARLCLALALATCFSLPSFGQRGKRNADKEQITQTQPMDSLSYALGVLFATNLSNEGLSSVDGESLKSGFEATCRRCDHVRVRSDAIVRTEMTKLKEQQAQAAKQEGESFLKENAKNEGIVTTASGLQYKHTVEAPAPPLMPRTKSRFTTAEPSWTAPNSTQASSAESPFLPIEWGDSRLD